MLQFNEAISFQVFCADQNEFDYYWEKLGGRRRKSPLRDPGSEMTARAMEAMLKMKMIDIADLEEGVQGVGVEFSFIFQQVKTISQPGSNRVVPFFTSAGPAFRCGRLRCNVSPRLDTCGQPQRNRR